MQTKRSRARIAVWSPTSAQSMTSDAGTLSDCRGWTADQIGATIGPVTVARASQDWAILCRAREQAESRHVEPVAVGLGRPPGERTRMSSLENDSQLEAREHRVPVDGRQVTLTALRVTLDELSRSGQSTGAGESAVDLIGGAVFLRPDSEQPAKVEQWIADCGHLPITDCGRRPVSIWDRALRAR
jgi:hypothetical protein